MYLMNLQKEMFCLFLNLQKKLSCSACFFEEVFLKYKCEAILLIFLVIHLWISFAFYETQVRSRLLEKEKWGDVLIKQMNFKN